MNRLPTNRLEGTRLLKWFGASTLRFALIQLNFI